MGPVDRVRAALRDLSLPGEVIEYGETTATAADAARAVGCAAGQIVKTLVFLADGRPSVVLVAGDRQADTARVAELLGVSRKRMKMGSPDEVLSITGFAVGGVAPVGLASPCDVIIDESLRRFDRVWAAAGSRHAVFPAATEGLAQAVRGQWAAIAREPA